MGQWHICSDQRNYQWRSYSSCPPELIHRVIQEKNIEHVEQEWNKYYFGFIIKTQIWKYQLDPTESSE